MFGLTIHEIRLSMRVLVIAVVTVSTLLLSFSYINGEDVISKATGIDAIRDLVLVEEYRDAIDLSPNQLIDLEKLLASPEAKKAANDGKPLADRYIQSKLNGILAEEQIRAMRIAYLRRKFPSADLVFRSELMEQIGADLIQATDVSKRSELSQRAFTEKFLTELRATLKSILAEVPAASRAKFQHFFGTDLFPSLQSSVPVDVNTIAILEDDRGVRFYMMLKLLNFAKPYELTSGQKDRLRLLGVAANSQRKNGPGAYKQFIEDGVREILKPDQHVAIVQQSHEMLLRLDLATLVRPEFLNFVALEDESRAAFCMNVERSRAELLKLKAANDRKIFNEAAAAFPSQQRELLVKLFEDVW